MANWLRKIELCPEWQQAQAAEITHARMAAVISERLKALKPFGIDHLDERRDMIADWFDGMARGTYDIAEFDDAMKELYDWGDEQIASLCHGVFGDKCCWINTIPRQAMAAKGGEA